jgi:alpha-galactosidase
MEIGCRIITKVRSIYIAITYNEQTRVHLQTNQSSYIFTVLENEQLGHLYYGKKMKHKASFQHYL